MLSVVRVDGREHEGFIVVVGTAKRRIVGLYLVTDGFGHFLLRVGRATEERL